MKMIVKSGRIIDPADGIDKIADILIENGKIASVGENLPAGDADVIDASGKIVTPGLVDMHCHLRDPGFEYKEDIISGCASAAAGGFTSIAPMPNTAPAADSAETIEYIIKKAKTACGVNVFPIGAVTKGLKGVDPTDLTELKASGAVAVSDDGRPVENSLIMLSAMKRAAELKMAVISHCEDIAAGKGDMNEGAIADELGLKGISPTAEEIMVARDAILSSQYRLPVHIAHVSTRRSVEIVRRAKKNGAPITCETCPHYFSLTERDVKRCGTNAKMNPPLRGDDDVAAIIEGLSDGTIDVIATDHAPHSADEKAQAFSKAPNGIVGFETAFAVSYTHLVQKGLLSLGELVEKMSVNPARILGINRGTLAVGAPADIAVFDTENPFTFSPESLLSKSKNTPYGGFELRGKLFCTAANGKIIAK